MNKTRILTVAAATVTAAAIAVGGTGTASAKSGRQGDVRTSGHCSAASVWKMKAKADDGRIQLEMEVDSNKVGQAWSVGITDNTVKIFTGSRRTLAPSGSFSAELRAANRTGVDHFVGTARNAGTGEVCVAKVSL